MDLSTVSLKSATALSEAYKQHPNYCTVLGFKSSAMCGEVVALASGRTIWGLQIEAGVFNLAPPSDHLQMLRSLQSF
jgi:hypothetical protein